MTSLFQAMSTGTGRTHNGAITNTTSFSKCLDLFNVIGSSRGKDLTTMFANAWKENPDVALRILQWSRDCRGGAGEREVFRIIMRRMAGNASTREQAITILRKVPALGYWKDVVKLYEVQEFRPVINEMIAVSLAADDGLCAKYMPRKGVTAAQLRKALGLEAREYRKLIVSMSNTVEQKMCAKNWNEIDFSKIPSLAAARYQKAFMKNAETNYNAYIAALEKGEAKINASTLFPYDVLKSCISGVSAVADQQWKALPNYMEGTDERVLPLIDVSGSMHCSSGINGIDCMHVAISLGMYLSDKQEGEFKDTFMTFDSRPQMLKASGTLTNRYNQIRRSPWGGGTDIQAVFDTLLNKATESRVAADKMPTTIVILSDMEFNSCYVRGKDASAFRMIEAEYARHGYARPKLVFWNLNGRQSNNPVILGEGGTCMVSGFSPAIMTSVLSAKDFDPYSIMLEAVMKDKYAL
jgi:hypothetical protein